MIEHMIEKHQDVFSNLGQYGLLDKISQEAFINAFVFKIINSMTDVKAFITLVDVFEKTAIETKWVDSDYENKVREEIEKTKKDFGEVTDKETSLNLLTKIATIKFSHLMGSIRATTGAEVIGIL